MIKNKLKKFLEGALMITSIIGTTGVASAATTPTDYGTMTYSLRKDSSNKIIASTSMPANAKPYSYLRTTLEIQINSTGERKSWLSGKAGYVPNMFISSTAYSDKGYSCKLAAYSAHEVVGKKGFVKYCSTTF